MTDLFPAIALGDALDEEQAHIVPYKCESAVTKGQIVIFNTHTAAELPSVSTAGAAAINAIGMAMKTGGVGRVIPVLMSGVCKATSTTGVTGGVLLVCGASGTVETVGANTFEKIIGRALQTLGAGDTGLVAINCER